MLPKRVKHTDTRLHDVLSPSVSGSLGLQLQAFGQKITSVKALTHDSVRLCGWGELSELITHGSCVSIAVRFKRLTASVSTSPFQIQHTLFQTDELHVPANERRPFGMK